MPIYTIQNLVTSVTADYLLKLDNTWSLTAAAGQPIPPPANTPLGTANGTWSQGINEITMSDPNNVVIDILEQIPGGDPTAPNINDSGPMQSGDQWTRQS